VPRILGLIWPTLRSGPAAGEVPEGTDEQPDFTAVLDRLDDISPRVQALERGVALVDATGLGPTHGEERRIAARAVALVREVTPAVPVRAGMGENRWQAILAARLVLLARPDPRVPAAFHALPPGAAARVALAPLPLGLLPADAELRQRLALFGLARMGELAALPRSAVGAQFGREGERLQQLARGEDPRPLVPRRRPERLIRRVTFEPPVEGIAGAALALRRCCSELCDRLRSRNLAPGRAVLTLELEDAGSTGSTGVAAAPGGPPLRPPPSLQVELTFPEPALEPDWIARLLAGRVEAVARLRRAGEPGIAPGAPGAPEAPEAPGEAGERRVVAIGLAFDRLGDPAARQLPAFEAQAGRWEELRWSLDRLTARFGEGRLWRAVVDRPSAALPELQARLTEIGPGAGGAVT
jgi:hypothetical protein